MSSVCIEIFEHSLAKGALRALLILCPPVSDGSLIPHHDDSCTPFN